MTTRRFLVAGVCCVLVGGLPLKSEETAGPPVTASNRTMRVSFDRFMNIHYSHHEPLEGWLTTGEVIQEGLRQWYPQMKIRQTVMDGTPQDLGKFLSALPGGDESDLEIVYLASYQSPAGAWEFPNREQQLWSQALRDASVKPHPLRIVVLDSCYAAAVQRVPEWPGKLASLTLLAGSARELTYELALSTKIPIDFRRRYPSAWEWTRQHLASDWNQKMSFLGLMWLVARVETPEPPSTLDGWRNFFTRCQHLAEAYKEKHGRKWFSSVQVYGSESEASGSGQ
jgi:hypothetical protein